MHCLLNVNKSESQKAFTRRLSHRHNASFSSFGPCYGPKWQISLPFHLLQLVKSLPFHIPAYSISLVRLRAGPPETHMLHPPCFLWDYCLTLTPKLSTNSLVFIWVDLNVEQNSGLVYRDRNNSWRVSRHSDQPNSLKLSHVSFLAGHVIKLCIKLGIKF